MTTYPLVQFVDAPSDDAVVRFDFNTAGDWSDTETWPNHDGWSLGSPTLEGDPDAFGVEWGFRRVTFNLVVKGTKTRAAAVMSRLSRELLRRKNWLRFQLSEFSPPVWIQTYRTESGPLDFELIVSADDATQDLWAIPVQLDADPFLYGERITLPPITIKNDASAATGNPMFVQLPEIIGDAETPLRLQMDMGGASVGRHGIHLILSHAAATPIRLNDATWTSADVLTTLPGGTVTEYTDGHAWSLGTTGGGFGKVLSAAPTVPYGTYKILARAGYPSSGGFVSAFDKIWVGHDISTLPIRRPFSLRSIKTMSWIDLGQITHPFGGAPGAGSGTLPLAVWYQNIYGGGFKLDEVLLIPVDDDEPGTGALVTHGGTGPGSARGGLYDAEADRVYTLDGSGNPVPWFPAAVQMGPLPSVIPGRPNTLVVTLGGAPDGDDNGSHLTDDRNDVGTWTISYQPRWLYLASVATEDA